MTNSQAVSSWTSDAERTAYVVVGMHRSGTSAVTQLLALAGAHLPNSVMPGDEHNAKGYFESWKIAIFNDQRLREGGSAWDDAFAFPYKPLSRKFERTWLNRATALFGEEYSDARFPLLKDPRVTVLFPFWSTVLADLEIGVRCVIPVRHPLAVAASLTRRNGFSIEKSLVLWSSYMLAAEAHTRTVPRAFVSYDGLLTDWRAEVARIETSHGAPLPNLTSSASSEIGDFLSADLRHNIEDGSLADYGWSGRLASRVYDWLHAAAQDTHGDSAAMDEAATILDKQRREFGSLVSPVARDFDIARTDLLETRRLNEATLEAAVAREAELQAARASDRQVLEAGWRADVERLEAAAVAREAELQAARASDRQVLEAGWRADVERLENASIAQASEFEAVRKRLESEWRERVELAQAELEALQQTCAVSAVQLKALL